MKRVTVVGANQCGFLLAFGLQDLGYEVSLYNRRSCENILGIRPRDVAFVTTRSLEMEARLGLNFWDETIPLFHRAWFERRGGERQYHTSLEKPLEQYSGRIFDQRIKFARWSNEFISRGGEFFARTLSPNELSLIAQQSLLTLVPADNSLTQAVFTRDEQRSAEQGPSRKLAQILVRPLDLSANTSIAKQKLQGPRFVFINESEGIYSLPFRTPAGDECRSYIIDAPAGGRLDRFDSVKDAWEALDVVKGVLQDFSPNDALIANQAQIVDPSGWGKMTFAPVIRSPVGVLPSGVSIMGVGDSFCPSDFVPGHYVNSTSHLADYLLRTIAGSNRSVFDDSWMLSTFSAYWNARYEEKQKRLLWTTPDTV